MRKKRKNEDKEPVTQTLALPWILRRRSLRRRDASLFRFRLCRQGSVVATNSRCTQGADAIERGPIVRLRAFVAGTGDLRRVQAIVSEVFTDRKLPLPVLTTVQVGALPMDEAQVELEATFLDRRVVNPDGIAFFPGERAPTIAAAVEQLKRALNLRA